MVCTSRMCYNSIIVSKIKTCSQNIIMFNYHGLIVSGSNPVLEDGHWIRVYQSKEAKLIDFNEKYIYHLFLLHLGYYFVLS